MRVITGSAKGRTLRSVPGESTRPIADRVKVALFDILSGSTEGSAFLDLFAGTGSVGIEALSRGAKRAVFVDSEPLAIRTIRENLESTRLGPQAEVIRSDSFRYLERREPYPFDIIYLAPPQYQGLWERALQAIDAQPGWLTDDGLAIAQIHPREYKTHALIHLVEFDQRKYGNTLLVFYEKPGA
jgi:16S rRNA (guanine966-N2)-methyltransferase